MNITPNRLKGKMAGNNSSLPPRACRRKRPYTELLQTPHFYSKPVPPVRKPSKFVLSDLKYILYSLEKNKATACFRGPPDPAFYPDYATVVPSHIDLTMIQRGVENGLYRRDQAKFKEDVEMIWANAMRYYPPSSTMHALAEACCKDFRALWRRLEQASNPIKSMEARVNDLEIQIKDVLKRLTHLSQRRRRPLNSKEIQSLETMLGALSPHNRVGLLAVLPKHVSVLGTEININMGQMSCEEFLLVKRYVKSCGKQGKRQEVNREKGELELQVRKGEAEIMQARAVMCSDSSDSSEESDEGEDNGQI